MHKGKYTYFGQDNNNRGEMPFFFYIIFLRLLLMSRIMESEDRNGVAVFAKLVSRGIWIIEHEVLALKLIFITISKLLELQVHDL